MQQDLNNFSKQNVWVTPNTQHQPQRATFQNQIYCDSQPGPLTSGQLTRQGFYPMQQNSMKSNYVNPNSHAKMSNQPVIQNSNFSYWYNEGGSKKNIPNYQTTPIANSTYEPSGYQAPKSQSFKSGNPNISSNNQEPEESKQKKCDKKLLLIFLVALALIIGVTLVLFLTGTVPVDKITGKKGNSSDMETQDSSMSSLSNDIQDGMEIPTEDGGYVIIAQNSARMINTPPTQQLSENNAKEQPKGNSYIITRQNATRMINVPEQQKSENIIENGTKMIADQIETQQQSSQIVQTSFEQKSQVQQKIGENKNLRTQEMVQNKKQDKIQNSPFQESTQQKIGQLENDQNSQIAEATVASEEQQLPLPSLMTSSMVTYQNPITIPEGEQMDAWIVLPEAQDESSLKVQTNNPLDPNPEEFSQAVKDLQENIQQNLQVLQQNQFENSPNQVNIQENPQTAVEAENKIQKISIERIDNVQPAQQINTFESQIVNTAPQQNYIAQSTYSMPEPIQTYQPAQFSLPPIAAQITQASFENENLGQQYPQYDQSPVSIDPIPVVTIVR